MPAAAVGTRLQAALPFTPVTALQVCDPSPKVTPLSARGFPQTSVSVAASVSESLKSAVAGPEYTRLVTGAPASFSVSAKKAFLASVLMLQFTGTRWKPFT